jgi:predicted short-subunit dehydrogenase-like oxidoreductase (DUF2520 family)
VTEPVSAASRIGIVGTGAVALALGRLMYLAGQPVVAVASRSRRRATEAALFIGASAHAATLDELPQRAERILIAVSDDVIAEVARALAENGMSSGVVLHTCGAIGPSALAALGGHVARGVVHPLQTIRDAEQGIESLVGAFFMTCGDEPATAWARTIAAAAGGQAIEIAADRAACYHAGAVMASNALMGVLDAAVRLMEAAGIEPSRALLALAPLARASLDNALADGPDVALTGPVARGDAGTIAAHVEALRAAPTTVRELYDAASRHLLAMAKGRGLPDASAEAVEAALDSSG